MAITRPAHLIRRQIGGRAFGERADLIRTVGMRNEYGEFESTETSTPIDCATSPPERRDDRVRVLTEGGVQLDALRAFWTVEDVLTSLDDTNPGDIILFANERWRARMTARWGGFSDTLGVRVEGQTVAALATSEFERTLRAFVAAGSGLATDHVIPGNDRGPRPGMPYASLLLSDDPRLAYPVRYQQPGDEMTTTVSYRRAAYSLQFYRDGAVDLARAFLRFAESEIGLTVAEDGILRRDANGDVIGAALDGGFRVVQTPPLSVQRLDEITGDEFEERALVDLLIDYADTSDQPTGQIDQFDCYVDYDGMISEGDIP